MFTVIIICAYSYYVTFLIHAAAGPPLSLTALNVGVDPDTFTITWNPPAQQNGVITAYEVQYKISTDLAFTSILISGGNTSTNLLSLITDVEYTIQVRAINAAGPGNFTNQLTVFNGMYIQVTHMLTLFINCHLFL